LDPSKIFPRTPRDFERTHAGDNPAAAAVAWRERAFTPWPPLRVAGARSGVEALCCLNLPAFFPGLRVNVAAFDGDFGRGNLQQQHGRGAIPVIRKPDNARKLFLSHAILPQRCR